MTSDVIENADTGTDADREVEAAGPGEPSDPAAAAPAKPRRLPVLILVAALALAIDVIAKILVVQHLSDRGPIHLPGGFLNLTLIRNSGAAFSIGEGQTWVFTIIAATVVFVILRVSRNLRSLPWACALGLLLGGALGNLADRIFREPGLFRGHVVDFLQFPTFPIVHYDFPVFNTADSAIVAGGCLMVLLSFLGIQPDGTRHRDAKHGTDSVTGADSATAAGTETGAASGAASATDTGAVSANTATDTGAADADVASANAGAATAAASANTATGTGAAPANTDTDTASADDTAAASPDTTTDASAASANADSDASVAEAEAEAETETDTGAAASAGTEKGAAADSPADPANVSESASPKE